MVKRRTTVRQLLQEAGNLSRHGIKHYQDVLNDNLVESERAIVDQPLSWRISRT